MKVLLLVGRDSESEKARLEFEQLESMGVVDLTTSPGCEVVPAAFIGNTSAIGARNVERLIEALKN